MNLGNDPPPPKLEDLIRMLREEEEWNEREAWLYAMRLKENQDG